MTEHNDEFERSLSERLRAHEARVRGGAAPNLATIGTGGTSRAGTAWGRGALVAAGGAAVGLILVLIFNGRPSPPTGQETATPDATSSLAPTATSTPSLPSLDIVSGAGLAARDELLAIIQVDGRLVGIGRHDDQGAVWTSLDGASWTLAPDLPAEKLPAGAATTMRSIVEGPAGLVAIGSWVAIENFGADDFTGPLIWYSADGRQWSGRDPSDASLGALPGMKALAAGGPGYVGVGSVSDDGFSVRPGVWSSADGREWSTVDSRALTGDLNDVIGGGGMLVAVGGNETAAVAFVSTDGATWTAAPEQEALQGAVMTSVTFGNGTFVAAGMLTAPGVPETPGIIWRSSDGLHWTLVLRGGHGQRFSQAVSTGEGFVAIGGQFPSAVWSYDPASPTPPSDTIQLWFSADGETWSGPATGFLADGGITLGRATVSGGDLFVPITLFYGPDGPVQSQPAILRGPLPVG